jgi:hypothetical protein
LLVRIQYGVNTGSNPVLTTKNKQVMNIELNKTYLTKNGKFVKIVNEPWKEIFNGDYEEDGRVKEGKYGRWTSNGKYTYFMFMGPWQFNELHDIIMEDCEEARILAEEMKIERKKKAYEQTM